jgi:hypothetical protein
MSSSSQKGPSVASASAHPTAPLTSSSSYTFGAGTTVATASGSTSASGITGAQYQQLMQQLYRREVELEKAKLEAALNERLTYHANKEWTELIGELEEVITAQEGEIRRLRESSVPDRLPRGSLPS